MLNFAKYEGRIRRNMLESLYLYVTQGVPVGDFLQAVLENNLVEAYGRADEENTLAMRDYADLLYNEMPSPSWGSKEKVDAWIECFQRARAWAMVAEAAAEQRKGGKGNERAS